jgi:hypothetical protein
MHRRLALVACCAAVFAVPSALADEGQPSTVVNPTTSCTHRCQLKRDYGKLRRHTDRNPIPGYIVDCESGGNYRALNPSSHAGGKYQVLPSTWRAYVAQLGNRFVRVAESVRIHFAHLPRHDRGPQKSSPLLQDRIAAMIWADSGPSAWSCA